MIKTTGINCWRRLEENSVIEMREYKIKLLSVTSLPEKSIRLTEETINKEHGVIW